MRLPTRPNMPGHSYLCLQRGVATVDEELTADSWDAWLGSYDGKIVAP